jgi:AcrR family transcriptional regulator
VRDLAGRVGLTAPRLYNAFGDKSALFALPLDRYVEHVVQRIDHLTASSPLRHDLVDSAQRRCVIALSSDGQERAEGAKAESTIISWTRISSARAWTRYFFNVLSLTPPESEFRKAR